MREREQRYDLFLATTAGIMGALVALLVGFGGAYYIFLREHLSALDARSEEAKYAICDALRSLRIAWSGYEEWTAPQSVAAPLPTPAWFYSYTDAELESRLRQRYSDAPEGELLRRVASDLSFGDIVPGRSLASFMETAPYPTLPWKGRIYYWILARSVEEITLSSYSQRAPADVFPASGSAPGFATWQQRYSHVRATVEFLGFEKKVFEADYFDFTSRLTNAMPAPVLNHLFQRSLNALDTTLLEIDKQLVIVSRAEIEMTRYSPDALTDWSLLLKIGLSFIAGVLVPVGLLLAVRLRRPPMLLAVISLLSLTLFGSAAVQMANANVAPRATEATAQRATWSRTLRAALDPDTLVLVGRFDTNVFDEFLRSPDVKLLDEEQRAKLRSFVAASSQLDAAAERLNGCLVEGMRAQLGMGVGQEGGFPLSTVGVMDEVQYDNWRRECHRARAEAIEVERPAPAGLIYPIGRLELPANGEEREELLRKIDNLRAALLASPESAAYLTVRTTATTAAVTLRESLAPADGVRVVVTGFLVVVVVLGILALQGSGATLPAPGEYKAWERV